MELLSNARKKLESCIFKDEFDRKYKNPTTKAIFIMYCICGGFCFDENVQKGYRKFWIIYNFVNYFVIYFFCIVYLMNAPVNNYYSLLLPVPIMSGLVGLSALYLWVYSTRDTFSKLFHFLESKNLISEDHPSTQSASATSANTEPKKSLDWSTIILLSVLIFTSIGCSQSFQKYADFGDYIIMLYPMYVPFEKTALIRFIYSVIQIVSLVPLHVYAMIVPTFLFATVRVIYIRFESLSFFIRDASESLNKSVNEIWMTEIAMEDEYVSSSLSKIQEMKIKKELASDEFMGKTIFAIKRHQELHSMAKEYASESNLIFSAMYIQITGVLIIRSFFISSIKDMKELRQSLPLLVVLCGLLLFALSCCFVGEMFKNMNKMVALEFYNSPWHNLEPRDRRLIHVFMTMTQRPIEIVACGLYPLNLSFFPNLLNSIYSQVQILRTLELKKQKRHG